MFDTEAITTDVVTRIIKHSQRIEERLTWPEREETATQQRPPTPLHEDIALFVRIANGEIDRATVDDQLIGDIIERVQRMLDLLFLPANGIYTYRVPQAFWSETRIGQVLAHVQAWLRQDDLIGLTEAAELLFPELAQKNMQAARMRVRRLTERGELMVYIDPSEPNPTQQTRVSRQAIAALPSEVSR
jgi:hypothetical protein